MRNESVTVFEHMLSRYPFVGLRGCDDAADILVRHCCLHCFSCGAVAQGAADLSISKGFFLRETLQVKLYTFQFPRETNCVTFHNKGFKLLQHFSIDLHEKL